MAAKTKINDHGDVIFTEQEAIDLLYINPEFDVSKLYFNCLLYTSPSPRDVEESRMPSSA